MLSLTVVLLRISPTAVNIELLLPSCGGRLLGPQLLGPSIWTIHKSLSKCSSFSTENAEGNAILYLVVL